MKHDEHIWRSAWIIQSTRAEAGEHVRMWGGEGGGGWRARQQTSPSWLGFFEGRPKVRSSNVTSAEGPRGIRSISITSVERFVWNYAMLQISGPLGTLIHLIPQQCNLYKFAFFLSSCDRPVNPRGCLNQIHLLTFAGIFLVLILSTTQKCLLKKCFYIILSTITKIRHY